MPPTCFLFLMVMVTSVGDSTVQGNDINPENFDGVLCHCNNKTLCPNESWPYCTLNGSQVCSIISEFSIGGNGRVQKKLVRQCVKYEKPADVYSFYNNVSHFERHCTSYIYSSNKTEICNHLPCQPIILSSKTDPSLHRRQCACNDEQKHCQNGICETNGSCIESGLPGSSSIKRGCYANVTGSLAFVKFSSTSGLFRSSTLYCAIGSFCNDGSINWLAEGLCRTPKAWNWPTLQKPLSPTSSGPKSCVCTEGDDCENGICKLKTANQHHVCYIKIVRFLMSPTVAALSRGCAVVERSEFANRRIISLSKIGVITIYFECTSDSNCNTNLDPVDCFLSKMKEDFLMQKLSKDDSFYCECTEGGMQEEYKKACSGTNKWCAKNVAKNILNISTLHFYCSNWGNRVTGCYFANPKFQPEEPFVLIDTLITFKDSTESRHQFCRGSKCQRSVWINDIFNCPHETDSSLDLTPAPKADDTFYVKKGKIDAANLLGTIGAIIVVFLTLFVILCVSVNALRIYQIEFNPEKKSEKKRRRGGLMAYITV